MRTRVTWILGIAVLIAVAVLVACSSKYSSSNNGLVVVSTQANAVMDTFSLDLGNGHISQVFNSNGPPTQGVPTSVVLDPAGDFAYVLVTQSTYVTPSATGIQSFSVASDGKLGSLGSPTPLNPETFTPPGSTTTESIPMVPVAMTIDSAGKFLFVADSLTTDGTQPVPGAVSVFAIGSGGALTEVVGPTTALSSPFVLPAQTGGTTPSASALAVTPTVYPAAYSICSVNVPPTTENLYVTDSVNYVVLNYSVSSSGVLTLVPTSSTPGIPTGTVPSGVTVDPCNRFVYVSNGQPDNSVSAFTVCNAVNLPVCTAADFSLRAVTGSPFVAGNSPGPLMMDAYANFLYVVDTGQNAISAYRVSTTTGSLTPLSPATITTNSFPTSIAIRSDDTWMFVANLNQATVSEYAITPATGALTPQPPIQTDNFPWGVAVK
ncbi:MAG: beta-propeller fold lactonase family protein [Candidatus Sulfotelmatobacter sp.]|jgi:6-phosphogluconolactonase (cycloisomerase 2 family)